MEQVVPRLARDGVRLQLRKVDTLQTTQRLQKRTLLVVGLEVERSCVGLLIDVVVVALEYHKTSVVTIDGINLGGYNFQPVHLGGKLAGDGSRMA